MKKVFKLLAIAMVVFSFASTVTSCKKDDDNDKSCCTIEDEGETVKMCEGEEATDLALEMLDMSWDEYKEFMSLAGQTCN